MLRPFIAIAVALVAITGGTWYLTRGPGDEEPVARPTNEDLASQAVVRVAVPADFTERERQGASLFEDNCAGCHGVNAAGSDNGPPLVHMIYEPGHHADESFLLAAERGVRSHHWEFGDMPPVDGVDRTDVELIVRYVRLLQRANGIR